MTKQIRKATVLGAGTMGAAIAAHLANAGIQVHLLDNYVPAGATDRAAFAKGQVERMAKARPDDFMVAGFMNPKNAKLITPGNLDDDLETALADSDWIVEAIVEDLDKKRALFARVDEHKKPDAIVSSNTSTIPLHDLTEGRSAAFQENFAVTHFFNPVRFMSLLELVGGKSTSAETMSTLRTFCDEKLGKTVIECNDTPGFIGNRIGTYFMFRTMAETIARGISVEDSDAILSKPLKLGKGTFSVMDQVGLALAPHLLSSLQRTLPASDAFRAIDSAAAEAIIGKLVQAGNTGRRSANQSGFGRLRIDENGKKIKQTADLKTGEYKDAREGQYKSVAAGRKSAKAALEADDALSDLGWAVLRDTLLYAASLMPEISGNIADIDTAMRTGYNWKKGPFEILDEVGHAWFVNRAIADGMDIPPVLQLALHHPFYLIKDGRQQHMTFDFTANSITYEDDRKPEGVLSLEDIKRTSEPLVTHASASLWDIGDGITCFEFHSTANTLDPSVMHVLNESIKLVSAHPDKYKGMVVYNDGKNFSVGANLGLINMGFDLAEKPFSMLNGLTPKLLRSLHIPKAAATTLQKAITPVCRLLDKMHRATTGKIIEAGTHKVVDDLIYQGQAVYKALREAPFPVVGAPANRALGGGCEILLHCDAVQAHAETYTGLVEAGVGVVPGWGGCVRTLERAQALQAEGKLAGGPLPPVRRAFETIARADQSVSTSAQNAMPWLRKTDGVTMNRDRLLADAKARALSLVPGYTPPKPATFKLPGKDAATAIKTAVDDFYAQGLITYHDAVLGDAQSTILSGGDAYVGKELDETAILHLEREAFASLLRTDETKQRIRYMLAVKKAFRDEALPAGKTLDEARKARPLVTLPHRPMDGKPLTGVEDAKLRRMANVTAFVLKFA